MSDSESGPRTAAGRTILPYLRRAYEREQVNIDLDYEGDHALTDILAIEAEASSAGAATLDVCPDCGLSVVLAHERSAGASTPDVELLAQAMLSRDLTTLHHCADCFEAEAEVIAAEYARLTEGTDR